MIPRPKATTRVATAIAAFVVFALAISVFAIPALRMRSGAAGDLGGAAAVQPLWPWHSIADVESFATDPHAIGDLPAADLDQPTEVAAAFGRQVLGWGDTVWAQELGVSPTAPCATLSNVTLGPIAVPSGDIGQCSGTWYGSSPGSVPIIEPSASTTSPPAVRTFSLLTCPPNTICGPSYPGPGFANVEMYQPLGPGGPWAVLKAGSQFARVSVGSADAIQDGPSINSRVQIPNGDSAELAIHVGGQVRNAEAGDGWQPRSEKPFPARRSVLILAAPTGRHGACWPSGDGCGVLEPSLRAMT